MHKNPSAGFSLIELMVAMVITLIIVGAVVGLLTSGQSAFSTQPERTDRQQNVRVAMDMIMRDVASAGVGMPPFIQAFSRGLNNRGPVVGVDGASLTDELEILTNNSGFDNEPICAAPGKANATNIRTTRNATFTSVGRLVMIFFLDGTWTVRNTTDSGPCNNPGTVGNCAGQGGGGGAGGGHCILDFRPGPGSDPTGLNTPGGVCKPSAATPDFPDGIGNAGDEDDLVPASPTFCGNTGTEPCCVVDHIGLGGIIRYRVQQDPATGIPNLERSENAGPFEVLARGVEDLQVQYVRSDAAWPATTGTITDEPVLVAVNDFTTLTTQVRVTLSARTTLQRIQGASTIGGDATTTALRGSLVSQASPRQALWVLTQESPAPPAIRWN